MDVCLTCFSVQDVFFVLLVEFKSGDQRLHVPWIVRSTGGGGWNFKGCGVCECVLGRGEMGDGCVSE